METLLIYNLKLSICVILFFMLYKLLFSRETFHRTNRLVLIGICTFTLFIPAITFEINNPNETLSKIYSYQQVLTPAAEIDTKIVPDTNEATNIQLVPDIEGGTTKNISWLNIISWIYVTGIIIFAIKLALSIIQIIRLIHAHKKVKLSKGILIIHEKDIAPFSWFNYIFISQYDYDRNGNIIIRHEQAHIASYHSWDLIVTEIISLFQWYNPSMWLIKKELQDIHEFEADALSIDSGIDAKEYQLLLIREAVGPLRFKSITNNFNQNKTKKRITMMLKEKSKSGNRWKYLAILPLVAISVALFAHPKTSNPTEVVSTVQAKENKSIEGTWKLAKANQHDLSQGQSSTRIITKNNFSWTMSNAEGLIIASTGGRYTYEKGVYTEYLDNTSDTMSAWKGKTVVINVEIKGNVMFCKGMVDNKVYIEEEWLRVE